MPFLIGTDEAGYGPNLGPLVVAVSAWRVPCDPSECDLYERLGECVTRTAAKSERLTIADSKELYKSASGLEALERNSLAAIGLLGTAVTSSRDAWSLVAPEAIEQFDSLPWHEADDSPLPCVADADEVTAITQRVAAAMQEADVKLTAIAASAVFPARFNALVDEYGSKGEALSQVTLQLLGRVLDACDGEPVLIVCDKHGGRGKYQRLLQEQFPDPLIEVVCEGLAESIYRWGPAEARREIRFRAGGESFLPAALASMTAKYLRELAMHSFNAYWQRHVTDLRPTAGYPVDARRFKNAIAAAQQSLGIEDRVLWRCR